MLNTEIKRKIDGARQILVGKVPDPKAQVEQITTALIYKFMDDMDKESVELGGKIRFFTKEYERYAWSKIIDSKLGGLERLNLYAEAITIMQRNPNIPQLFRDIFKDAFLPYRDPETLSLFLKEINGFIYDHSENLGNAFEYLLSVLGSQGDAGQFRTPRHIIDFIVEVVHPTKDDRILDPACGTAGFLISAYKNILAQHDGLDTSGKKNNEKPLTPDERTKMTKHFVGYDISPDMVRLSLVNLYLHGFQDPKIFEYDTLTSQEKWDETFDVVLANPPFMTPTGGIRPHNRFSVKANRAEVLFTNYILEHLNPKGRAGIIVPEGIVFQSGNAYKQLRKLLIDAGLYAVVSLPPGVFNPYSGVKTSVLLIDKEMAKMSSSVLFVKILSDGFDLGAQRKRSENDDLPRAEDVIKEFVEKTKNKEEFSIKDDHAWLVEKSLISQSGEYLLTGDKYKSLIDDSRSDYEFVELGEYVEESRERAGDKKHNAWSVSNKSGFVLTEEYFDKKVTSDDTKNYKIIHENYFAYNPSRINVGSIALNKRKQVGIVSPMYVVFNIKDRQKLLPDYLLNLLKSEKIKEQIKQLSNGAVREQLRYNDLCKIKIPLPSLYKQDQILKQINKLNTLIKNCNEIAEVYSPTINIKAKWKTQRLDELCVDFKNGVNFSKEQFGKGVPVVNIKDLFTGMYIDNKNLDLVDIPPKELARNKILDGDLLFVRSSVKYEGVGFPALAKIQNGEQQTFCGFVIKCTPKKDIVLPEYLLAILRTAEYREKVIALSNKANITNISQPSIKSIEIPVPSLEQQKIIVESMNAEVDFVERSKASALDFQNKINMIIEGLIG